MTTPQSELKRLSDSINRLCNLFDSDDGDDDMFTRINRIDTQTHALEGGFKLLQLQISLIIKLLAKDDSVG